MYYAKYCSKYITRRYYYYLISEMKSPSLGDVQF